MPLRTEFGAGTAAPVPSARARGPHSCSAGLRTSFTTAIVAIHELRVRQALPGGRCNALHGRVLMDRWLVQPALQALFLGESITGQLRASAPQCPNLEKGQQCAGASAANEIQRPMRPSSETSGSSPVRGARLPCGVKSKEENCPRNRGRPTMRSLELIVSR